MNLAEALEAVAAGERVTSDALPLGTVLKTEQRGWERSGARVIWEGTGDGFDFRARPEHEAADWRIVKGWAVYA